MRFIRITALNGIRGPEYTFDKGFEASVPGRVSEEVAEAWVAAGAAEWMDGRPAPKVEQATEVSAEERETADEKPRRRTKEEVFADKPEWDMKISPEAYLERWPEGPKAEAAKKLVGE